MSESPKPSVIPSREPRARVSNHLRHLLTLGATSMTLACWPLACDPLPPPAACADKGSVLDSLEAEVTVYSGQVLELNVRTRDDYRFRGVQLTRTAISGGTANALTLVDRSVSLERVTPASPSAVVELTYSATCERTAARGIRVTLTPRAGDAGTADAGASDGGTPANYTVTITEL